MPPSAPPLERDRTVSVPSAFHGASEGLIDMFQSGLKSVAASSKFRDPTVGGSVVARMPHDDRRMIVCACAFDDLIEFIVRPKASLAVTIGMVPASEDIDPAVEGAVSSSFHDLEIRRTLHKGLTDHGPLNPIGIKS